MQHMPTSSDSSGKAALSSLPPAKKLLLLLCNAHVAAMAATVWLLRHSPWTAMVVVLGVLYVLPPLVCRAVLAYSPALGRSGAVPSRRHGTDYVVRLRRTTCDFPYCQ